MGFPSSSVGKKSACIAGDLGLISGLGQTPRKGRGYPLQYSGLENSMNSIGHGVRLLIIIFTGFSLIVLKHFFCTINFDLFQLYSSMICDNVINLCNYHNDQNLVYSTPGFGTHNFSGVLAIYSFLHPWSQQWHASYLYRLTCILSALFCTWCPSLSMILSWGCAHQ